MRTLNLITWAVVVMAAITGCTTDTTEDLAVKGGGKTTLTLSLDNSRTQLGEKADGVYPLTWAEGDKISVNGIASKALTFEESGTSRATFTFETENLSTPYCIAYPAAEAGQVVFAEKQYHAGDGTFGNGAAAMYGYGANGGSASLKHLTAVLKVGITSDLDPMSAPVLQSIEVRTSNNAPIAGVFDIDFETGKLTPTDKSVNKIDYIIDERLRYQQPIYIHIAVPAGVYDALYLTITDRNGDIMNATIKAPESKPLRAGTIREFSTDVMYNTLDKSNVFIINSYESLIAFKAAIEAAQSSGDATVLEKDAVMTSDVEISDNWTPINCDAWVGTFRGNGFAIKGLNNSLFTRASASFDGLHLTDVNITSIYDTTNNRVGALTNTYLGSSIKNCTVNGKIEISKDGVGNLIIGGFVGHHLAKKDTEILNCENRCEISITSTSTKAGTVRIGGISAYNEGKAFDNIIGNCKNSAPITVDGTRKASTHIGGILASSSKTAASSTALKIINCSNNGDITNKSTNNDTANTRGFHMGGILGYCEKANFEAQDCINNGNVSNTGEMVDKGVVYAGGCFGNIRTDGITVTNCDNYGVVSFTGNSHGACLLGGVASDVRGVATFANCDNFAKGNITDSPTSRTKVSKLGGICADFQHIDASQRSTFTDCTNYAKIQADAGAASSSSDLNSDNTLTRVGGGFGNLQATTSYDIELNNVDNHGSLVLNFATCNSHVACGGVVGALIEDGLKELTGSLIFKNCDNICDEGKEDKLYITNGDYLRQSYSGGIIGISILPFEMSDCSNNMSILFDANKAYKSYAGGACARVYIEDSTANTKVLRFTNSGDITYNPKGYISGWAELSGIGLSTRDGGIVEVSDSTNSGDMHACNITGTTFIGGLYNAATGSKTSVSMNNCHNTGNLSTSNCSSFAYIGGLMSYLNSGSTVSLTKCHNEGEINVNGNTTMVVDENASNDLKQSIGGIVSYLNGTLTLTDCYNDAAISVTGTIQIPRAGGILGGQNEGSLTLNNVYNSEKGSITFGTKEQTLTASSLNVGGILGSVAGENPAFSFTAPVVNKGDITVTNSIVSDANLAYIGGIASCLTTLVEANAECYCTVKGYYWDGTTLTTYPNMGMVTGAAYSDTVKATNCKVGGKFCEGGIVDGGTFTESVVELNASNFYSYCYSNRDLTSIDGVTLME